MLAKLKGTLVSAGAALVLSAVLLVGLVKAGSDEDGFYGALGSVWTLAWGLAVSKGGELLRAAGRTASMGAGVER